MWKLANSRSLSSVDEAEIPGPAVPAKRHQLVALMHGFMECRVSDDCVVRELTTVGAEEAPTASWLAYFAVFAKLCYVLVGIAHCCF